MKIFKRISSILIFCFLVSVNCSTIPFSAKYNIVEGYVYDYYTNEPLKDIPVSVNQYSWTTDYRFPDSSFIDSTDSNGYYFIKFYQRNDKSYYCEVPGIWRLTTGSPEVNIEDDSVNNLDFIIKLYKPFTVFMVNKTKVYNEVRIDYTGHYHNSTTFSGKFDFSRTDSIANSYYLYDVGIKRVKIDLINRVNSTIYSQFTYYDSFGLEKYEPSSKIIYF